MLAPHPRARGIPGGVRSNDALVLGSIEWLCSDGEYESNLFPADSEHAWLTGSPGCRCSPPGPPREPNRHFDGSKEKVRLLQCHNGPTGALMGFAWMLHGSVADVLFV